jgi:hypothetical protein
MTDREPLSLLAMRAVSNAASFSHGHRPAHPALVEAQKIIVCLYYETNRNDLWRATEQLCQGTVYTAMETVPPAAGTGLDALMTAVERANDAQLVGAPHG